MQNFALNVKSYDYSLQFFLNDFLSVESRELMKNSNFMINETGGNNGVTNLYVEI